MWNERLSSRQFLCTYHMRGRLWWLLYQESLPECLWNHWAQPPRSACLSSFTPDRNYMIQWSSGGTVNGQLWNGNKHTVLSVWPTNTALTLSVAIFNFSHTQFDLDIPKSHTGFKEFGKEEMCGVWKISEFPSTHLYFHPWIYLFHPSIHPA